MTNVVEFYISQMSASIIEENLTISPLLKSQTRSAPVKADIWRLRCEKEELINIKETLCVELEKNSQINTGIKTMVIEEVDEICKKHT
jgi:hypothetical protein